MKKDFFLKCTLIYVVFLASTAFAVTLKVGASSSTQTKGASLAADGDFADSDWSWNSALNQTTSESKDTITNETITDKTSELNLGVGFINDALIDGGVSLSYSKTPEENLTSLGPSLNLGYTYKFSSDEKILDKKKVFRSSTGFNAKIGQQNYEQQFSTGQRKLAAHIRPSSGNNTIRQQEAALSLKTKPYDWVQIKLTVSKYTYNKDVNSFLQYLDSHKLIAQKSIGISNALAGFEDRSFTARLYFYFLDTWELDVGHTVTHIISYQSTTTSESLEVSDELTEKWKLIVAGETAKSNNAVSEASQTISLNVEYEF